MSAPPFLRRASLALSALSPVHQSLLLWLLTLCVLYPGIGAATGLTGKDEFFLGLRTPMEMLASDHWLVPFLDDAPRIRKPPFLYWLGRVAYETLGVSLTSARLVAVLFASLLVVASAGIARQLTGQARSGWLTAGILLSCLGLASEGRRFMLDVPVAALSTSAFWALLLWLDLRRLYWLTVSTLLLAAAFLTKGPIAALVCGSGLLALLASRRLPYRQLLDSWRALLAHALLWAALALPWFALVRHLYPGAAQQVLDDELASRQFFNLSPGIVLGLLNIALPWVFVFIATAWQQRRQAGLNRCLLLWFAASFLPFLLIKSFDRYLLGSLVPLAIFLAVNWSTANKQRWAWRAGALLAVLLGGLLALLTWCLGDASAGWRCLLSVVPAAYLLWAWWHPRSAVQRCLAPALFWLNLLASVFPALGVNAVPATLVEFARQQPVAFFNGPQPAMLPALSGQAHRHYRQLDQATLAALAASGKPLFIEDEDQPSLLAACRTHGYQAALLGNYATLASHGSGLRFARSGAGRDEWLAALRNGDPSPLQTRILWFRIHPLAPPQEQGQ